MTQKEIRIFGKKVLLTLRNEGDFAIANELFLDHQYRYCDQTIRGAKNAVIDIGGHLGFFSLYTALLNPNVPIYTFEPHEGNFALLKENLKNNHIKNVTPKMLALADHVGQTTLQLSKEDLNHSTVQALEPTGETQMVQTTTLERVFEKNRIEKCDLIKIDCEGAEFAALYGTPKPVFDRIENLFIEYHDWAPENNGEELKQFLKKQGYHVEKYPNSKIKELGFLWCQKAI